MPLPHPAVVIAALLASAIATAGAQTTYRWTDKATGQPLRDHQLSVSVLLFHAHFNLLRLTRRSSRTLRKRRAAQLCVSH